MLRRGAARIAEYEFWLLWVFAVPLLFASNLPFPILLGALGTVPLFWLARRIARGAWSVSTPLDLPLALLLCLGIVGIAVSNERQTSLRLYAELVGGVALYYGIVNGMTTTRVERGAWVLVALGIGMGVTGLAGLRYSEKFLEIPLIYQYLPKYDFSFLNPRGFTPNIVAGALAPLAVFTFGLGMTQTPTRRFFLLLLAFFFLAVVTLTQSRGALAGIVAAVGIVLLLWLRHSRWLLPLILIGMIAIVALFSLTNFVNEILVNESSASATERLELWDRSAQIMRDFPFTGIGIGTFEPTVRTLYPLLQSNPGAPQPHAHNFYLQMGLDYGIGGMVAYLGLVTGAVLAGWRAVVRTPRTDCQWLALALVGGYLVFLIHSLLDAVGVSTKVSTVIWFLLGLLIAYNAREKQHTV